MSRRCLMRSSVSNDAVIDAQASIDRISQMQSKVK
nr:MAG TPA: hypothetical protein [Caudoviricetes sp.]